MRASSKRAHQDTTAYSSARDAISTQRDSAHVLTHDQLYDALRRVCTCAWLLGLCDTHIR
jgi:hypothetical protein